MTCRLWLLSVPCMFRVVLALIAAMLLRPDMAHAVVVSGLYEAEVAVADQSPASYRKGTIAALREVLIKLTGDRHVQALPAAAPLLEEPEKFVQQYKYHNKAVIRDNQLTLDRQLFLWVRFNAGVLERELRRHDLPVWGTVRPSTLIWLVVQDDSGMRFVGLEDEKDYTGVLDSRAYERGIVLNYPLLDGQDAQSVAVADIRGEIAGAVLEASRRYPSDAVLAGNVEFLSPGQWTGRWSAYVKAETHTWAVQGSDPAAVLEEGVDRLADLLAEHYVQTHHYAGASGLEIVVNDIADYDQYSKVLKYLASLNSVLEVNVTRVEPQSVTFLVTASGGEDALTQAIELGNTLQSVAGTGSPYRLLP